MADERYVIEFDATGIPVITKNLRLMNGQATRSIMTVKRLKKHLLELAAIKMPTIQNIVPPRPINPNSFPKEIQPRMDSAAASTKKLTLAMGHLGGQVRALAGPLATISQQTQVNAASMARLTAKANKNADAIARLKAAGQTAIPVFSRLGGLIGTFGALMATRKVIEYGDAWANLTNKLRIVSDSEADLIAKRKALIAVSNQTRSSLEGNITLFQRLSMANRSLGKSDKELIRFTDAISKSLAISGATAQETRSVLIQLAQGLGSDAVRGEEFRAVMESGSRVMQALADSTGKTVGQLKELTAQGKFLSVDFFDAVMKQAPAITSDFEKIAVTVGTATNVFRNNMVIWIGRMNEATGAGNKLGSAIIGLSENLTALATGIALVGVAALIPKLATIQLTLVAMTKTTGILALNMAKVAFFAVAMGAWASALNTIFAETAAGGNVLVTFGFLIEATGKQIKTLFEFLPAIAKEGFAKLKFFAQTTLNHIKNEFAVLAQEIEKGFKLDWKSMLSPDEINAQIAQMDAAFREGLIEPTGSAFTDMAKKMETDTKNIATAYATLIDENNANTDRTKTLGEKLLGGLQEDWAKVTALFQDAPEVENPLAKLGEDNLGGGGGEGFLEFLTQIREVGTEAAEVIGRITDPEAWGALGDTLENSMSTKSFFGGIKEGFEEASMSAADFKKGMIDLTVQGIKGFSDQMTLALTKGDADFKSFALSIIRQLISMMIQAMVTATIMAALGMGGGVGATSGSSGGGGGSSVAGVMGQLATRQFGGPVQAGQPTLVGERRPEIFVPQTAGRIEARADGSGQQQTAPSIVNVVDEQMFHDAMAGTEGERIIMNVISRNQNSRG